MKRCILAATCAALLIGAGSAPAHGRDRGEERSVRPVDVAVIGDIPYGHPRIENFPANIAQINADPTVRTVMHLGDIKNGSSSCDTPYFEQIRSDFDQFQDPLVYTPGDNEWTDCHRANNGGYQPAGPVNNAAPVQTAAPESRLDAIRHLFFDRPGHTLGADRRVTTQGAPLVENVRFAEARVPFATMNVPGSNNDLKPWFGAAQTPALQALQADEYRTRNAANLRWLDALFAEARERRAPALVIGIQADMWDPAIFAGGPSEYSGFTDFVRALARQSVRFAKPVLLLNGDSHLYEADKPLADPASPNNTNYGVAYAVANLSRVTVDGSDNADDYLKLHVDPRASGVFSYQRIPYTG